MKNSIHTQTPWKSGTGVNSKNKIYVGDGSRLIADCDTINMMAMGDESANAAFIVKAVNFHYKLVEQLKDAASYFDAAHFVYGSGDCRKRAEEIRKIIAAVETV